MNRFDIICIMITILTLMAIAKIVYKLLRGE